MRLQPRQDYHPSCRVRLIVRLEDWASADAPKGPSKPPHLRAGLRDEAPLVAKQVAGRFVLTPKGEGDTQAPGGPQGQVDGADPRVHVIDGVVPMQAEVRRRGIREADEASVSLHFADLPIDPRTIRALGVEIFMGTVTPDDYRAGVEGTTAGDTREDGGSRPLSAVPDTYLDPYGRERSNKRFSGWADEVEVEFPDGDPPTIRLECMDNTKLLADVSAPPKLTIAADLPVDEAVAQYLANFPQCAGLEVELRPLGSAAPTLKTALAKSAYKPDLGPPGDGKSTLLDYVADTLMALGYLCWVEGVALVIQKPRTLYAGAAIRAGDPFTGRRLPDGRVIERRTLLYGLNVKELSFSRKLGRKQAESVEVRCYSGRLKKTIVARHPGKGDRPTSATPGGQGEEKWRVVEVQGVEDEASLRAVAQAVYEASGRHELTCRVQTPCLGSLGGGNEDPDLLDVEHGDPVDVEAVRPEDFAVEADDESSFAGGSSQEPSRAEAHLVRLGYSRDFARAYAESLGAVGFPTTFRVSTWAIAWDADGGGESPFMQVSGELMNYVEARMDREAPEGEEPELSEPAVQPVAVRAE